MKIMRCKFLPFLLFALFLNAFSLDAAEITAAEADAAIRQLWLDGFLKMSRAAQLADQGKPFPAMQGYNDAMKMFEDVHRRFPKWNTVMVTYHISSCRLRIQQLEKTILPDLGKLSAEELRTRLQEEINRNAALSMELQEIRQDSRYTINDTRLRERETLISALRQQITELEVKLKLEQTKLSRMKTDDDFTKLHNELAELAMVKQKDNEKINALTHDLEDAGKKIDSLQKQLAEVDKWTEAAHSTDAVKDENEQLKQIIADQNRKLVFFQENVAVFLQNKKEIEQLERMAFDLENKSDISSAAYFLVAGLIVPGSSILLRNVGINPTRAGILTVLRAMGGDITLMNRRDKTGEPSADILVRSSALHGTRICGDLIPTLIDEIPVLAVAAAAADGDTVIADAEELKVKESDRIAVCTENLRAMGAEVTPSEDRLTIAGGKPLHGALIRCHADHRIAMSFAVASLIAEGSVDLDDESCVRISYPGFFRDLTSLRR